MPTQNIIRTERVPDYTGRSAGIRVDTSDNLVKVNADGTERTLVDLASTQTLTNKTIGMPAAVEDGVAGFAVVNDDDATKEVRFEVDGATTDTTTTLTFAQTVDRAVTLPDADDTLVGKATTDTLTNKSIALGSNTVTGTLAEFNTAVTDANFASQAGSETLTNKTLTAPGGTGFPITKLVTFTEDATNTTHTGTVTLPAGSWLHDIRITSSVLWGGGTATMDVGDTADPNGYFTAIDVKATDLAVGEVIAVNNDALWGGKEGAYLVAATGQRGPTTDNFGQYYAAGSDITGVVTVGTPASTAGRTFMLVTYSVGAVVAAVASGA